MQGDSDGHMLVGEASGANKAGGCLEGVSPFAITMGAWQRLTTPASALRSGVVEARVAAWRRIPLPQASLPRRPWPPRTLPATP
jgi:hypothetical protein